MHESLVFKVARTKEETVRAAEFTQGVFGHGRDYILGHPDVQFPGSVRYVEHHGAVVSAHVLEHMELALGEGYAKAARIEYVATHESFRRRGLCRRLINDTLAFLRDNGTQIGLIFGQPFFRDFGFEYCVPTYEQDMPVFTPPGSAIVPAAALKRFVASAPVVPLKLEDLPMIADLHRKDNPQGNLSRRRSMVYWKFLVSIRGIETYRVVRRGSSVLGYFRLESSPGRAHVKEVVAATSDVCSTILNELYRCADRLKAEAVVFHCPHSGTFGSFLRRHGAAQYSPFAERQTNLQLRVLDLAGCLGLLRESQSLRLRQSELAGTAGRWRLIMEDDQALLQLGSGRIDVVQGTQECKEVRVPGKRMAQLVSGFRVHEAAQECDGTSYDRRLLEVLFPSGDPYWYVDDL